jgi:hypothetical protein
VCGFPSVSSGTKGVRSDKEVSLSSEMFMFIRTKEVGWQIEGPVRCNRSPLPKR